MTQQLCNAIVSRDVIRKKARDAFLSGRSRDDHHMNPTAPALEDWLAEYDRMAAMARHTEHSALMRGPRVDVRQSLTQEA